ncbi:MAG TPA: type II secretion system minor pseudopilin GspK [Pseudomonadales bacterium]|nr:type II secretion system minor pseudopilin GspK [Pseudomonadales bacterium]
MKRHYIEHRRTDRQHGVAIVLAMGVVALAALIATAIVIAQGSWTRQVELGAQHTQATHMLDAGLEWARAVLGDDRRSSTVDHLGEPWAMQLPAIPVENGSLIGHIEDEQGKFNLNNLLQDGKINLTGLTQFRRLLVILALPPTLADTLADWLDSDSEPQPQGGAEDAFYLSQPAPMLTANQPLVDIAELAVVAGFDDSVRLRLRPFVTALPGITAINVNTATPEVLAAMVEGLSLDTARAITAQREHIYFRSVADFRENIPQELSVANENIAVSSDYFLATLRVTLGDAQTQGTALLSRKRIGWPTILWRKNP